ncbi:MAG: DUF29 family protein, partial [Desulfobacterales bacterium]
RIIFGKSDPAIIRTVEKLFNSRVHKIAVDLKCQQNLTTQKTQGAFFMEELFQLRKCIENQDYAGALSLIGEMEEMSRDDKISKIGSYLEVLLLHLIKQHAEKRTTRSWDISIRNSVRAVARISKRRKTGGYYLDNQELELSANDVWPSALDVASLEAFEGRYDSAELEKMIDSRQICTQALQMIQEYQTNHVFRN